MTITIYHNPRCGKSRQALAKIESQKPKIIEYLNDGLSEQEIKLLLQKLRLKAIDLVRTKEDEWKKYKGKYLTESEVIRAIVQHPKLLQRPIVVKGTKAIIARPPELLNEFLN